MELGEVSMLFRVEPLVLERRGKVLQLDTAAVASDQNVTFTEDLLSVHILTYGGE